MRVAIFCLFIVGILSCSPDATKDVTIPVDLDLEYIRMTRIPFEIDKIDMKVSCAFHPCAVAIHGKQNSSFNDSVNGFEWPHVLGPLPNPNFSTLNWDKDTDWYQDWVSDHQEYKDLERNFMNEQYTRKKYHAILFGGGYSANWAAAGQFKDPIQMLGFYKGGANNLALLFDEDIYLHYKYRLHWEEELVEHLRYKAVIHELGHAWTQNSNTEHFNHDRTPCALDNYVAREQGQIYDKSRDRITFCPKHVGIIKDNTHN